MENVNFGQIGGNAAIMTITVVLLLAVYALKTLKTNVATADWLITNWVRFAVGFVIVLAISTLIVVSPDVNILFGALGFNAEQSPIALGIFVTTLLIGVTTEPSEGGS